MQKPVLIGAALLAVPCLAGAEPLDVKTGLWQLQTSFAMQGDMGVPDSALAGMPPEQQAKIRAAMANMQQNMKKPHESQKCVTAAELDRGLRPHAQPNEQCQTKYNTRTGKVMDMQETCTGQTNRTGSLRFEALDRETIVGTGHFTMDRDGKPSVGDLSIHGKFLAASCGDVKPSE